MAWTNLSFPFGSTLTSSQMTQLDDNFDAFAAKDPGAPVLANLYVTESMMAAASVSQTKLKTTTASQSVFIPFGPTSTTITPTGGDYSFALFAYGSGDVIAEPQYNTSTAIGYYSPSTGGTAFLQSRYVQASPPYDLGDGEIGLFVFVLLGSEGQVLATSVAEDPPWAYHGPTNIGVDYYDKDGRGWRGEQEVTQAIKQADMPLVPHPWFDQDIGTASVVMLDPFNPDLPKLKADVMAASRMLHDGQIKIGKPITGKATPPGVVFRKWSLL